MEEREGEREGVERICDISESGGKAAVLTYLLVKRSDVGAPHRQLIAAQISRLPVSSFFLNPTNHSCKTQAAC